MDVHRGEKSSDTLPSVEPFGPAASGDGKKHNRHVYVVIFLVAAATIRLAFSGVGPAATAPIGMIGIENGSILTSIEIKWTPCYDGHQCSRSSSHSTTPPRRQPDHGHRPPPRPAVTTPRRGTILINPGGPGGSGTDLAGRAGANISQIVNSFDPSQRKIFDAQRGAWAVNRTDSTTGVAMARQEIVGARCEANIGGEDGIARYMSTASVSRDMIEISSRVGEEKLNYWGFSYGSVLGQYFAAMYPDKVGRVIIDGVFDAESYRSEHWSTNLLDMEAVMDSLFDYCYQAGPLKCSLYESDAGSDQSALRTRPRRRRT
ncbi:uncharacterized protein BXZ73DRAFT_104100 [Epithele typhae]|uniref:uncharacterized protein n=1 Tax=Epithele typhae TaxID=378194 RepID=UPI002008B19F|nr:uncharacterized protein BXZ73DRAFT_104100 [Epithele typhae]KAH9922875.1 hypothetical protein BXZ73DRAFT_104100 [Epithele typhae]